MVELGKKDFCNAVFGKFCFSFFLFILLFLI